MNKFKDTMVRLRTAKKHFVLFNHRLQKAAPSGVPIPTFIDHPVTKKYQPSDETSEVGDYQSEFKSIPILGTPVLPSTFTGEYIKAF